MSDYKTFKTLESEAHKKNKKCTFDYNNFSKADEVLERKNNKPVVQWLCNNDYYYIEVIYTFDIAYRGQSQCIERYLIHRPKNNNAFLHSITQHLARPKLKHLIKISTSIYYVNKLPKFIMDKDGKFYKDEIQGIK